MTQQTKAFNVFIAIDGSKHSLASIDLLKSLNLSGESRITLLAVVESLKSPHYYQFTRAIAEAEASLSILPFKINKHILQGHPAGELVRYADANKPDLILMGAKGLRATLGILLGGVAQQVVEHASWPVLVTRAPYEGLNRVLLVLDGSPCSENALSYSLSFPFPPPTQIIILHVLPPLVSEQEIMSATWATGLEAVSTRPYLQEEITKAQQEEEIKGRELVQRAEEALGKQGFSVSSHLLRGDAATEILAYIGEHKIDLIVAGSRGLSPISSWLLGSVSRKLVHYASCSVLIVKGNYCADKQDN